MFVLNAAMGTECGERRWKWRDIVEWVRLEVSGCTLEDLCEDSESMFGNVVAERLWYCLLQNIRFSRLAKSHV